MLDEKEKIRIGELRNLGLSVAEVAGAVKRGESTVKRYSSDEYYEEDNEKTITQTKNTHQNDGWMGKLFGDGWEDDIELMQNFFNFNQLADKSERDLKEYFKSLFYALSQYYRYTNTPIKLFDIFMDISSNLTFFENGYNIDEAVEVYEEFYDECIFIRELKEEYGSIEEFKEAKEQEIEDIRVKNDSRFEKLVKISNQLKEINQELTDENIKAKNFMMNQGIHYRERLKKLIHPKKIKEIIKENYVLNQLFKEFGYQYPKELKEFVEMIKSREVNEIQHSEKAIS